MIRTLDDLDIEESYLKKHLLKWFDQHYARPDSELNHDLRRAICYLDWRLFRPTTQSQDRSAKAVSTK